MRRIRVIPVLLVRNGKLVKTIQFKNDIYVGDPVNAIKIFNDKEVDELVVLDIGATPQRTAPRLDWIEQIASECFMPLGYGGGITQLDQIKRIFGSGVEKVVLNTAAVERPEIITEAAKIYGSQSIVVAIDVKKSFFGGQAAYTHGGQKKAKNDILAWVKEVESRGAGEILINSIDRDGTSSGYDTELLRRVTAHTSLPVIACGGARSIDDFRSAVSDGGASAVAAGSFFVFNGKHKAVLISYPSQQELREKLYSRNRHDPLKRKSEARKVSRKSGNTSAVHIL